MARRTALSQRRQISELNMTPLIDLTFLLLITFVITFPLIDQGISVSLHKGKAGEALYLVNADPRGKGDPRTRHAGLPTRSGNKWILSQYCRDRALPFLS